MTPLLVMALLAFEPLRWRFGPWTAGAALLFVMLVSVSPPLAVFAGLVGLGFVVWSKWQARRRIVRQASADVSELARGTLVAVSAGLSVLAALDVASRHLSVTIQIEVGVLKRSARQSGLAVALTNFEGACAHLFAMLARAQTTGASVHEALGAFVDEQREHRRLATVEAARRLPVKLTVPLALLILPGFVVLTVGPSVLESARRLLGPVLPIP